MRFIVGGSLPEGLKVSMPEWTVLLLITVRRFFDRAEHRKIKMRNVEVGIAVAVAAVLIVVAVVHLSTDQDLEGRAREFIGLLSEGGFENAHDMLSGSWAMTAEEFKELVWDEVVSTPGHAGKFKRITRARTATEEATTVDEPGIKEWDVVGKEFDVIYLKAEFENDNLDVKVIFDENSRILGLWFFPSES